VSVRVAAIQHGIVWHDRTANFDHLTPMIAGAVASGANVVLLTETFSTGFSFDTPGVVTVPS
jgi:predicted amidohydrolase